MAKKPWEKHIGTANNGFATAQDYAKAIQQKEASGQALSDPVAAAAFKSANPSLFSAPSVGGKSSSTIPSAIPANAVASNIQYFGSPEAYAQKINEKEASGIPLSDPASAAIFKQQNPQLFPGEQKKNILQQLQDNTNNQSDVTKSPYYDAYSNLAKQRGDIAERQTLENLNQRGILNSSDAAFQTAQARQQAENEILPVLIEKTYGMDKDKVQNLMSMLKYWSDEDKAQKDRVIEAEKIKREEAKAVIDKKEKEVKRALDEIKEFKYVTNYASKVLGIPVNTKTADALKIAHDMNLDIQRLKVSQGQLAVSQGQLGVAQSNLEIRRRELEQKGKEEIDRKESADNYGLAYEELDKLAIANPKKSVGLDWLKQNKSNFNDADYKSLVNYINSKDSPFE